MIHRNQTQFSVAPVPYNERERLNALYNSCALELWDCPELDNITQSARRLCRAPMALIALVNRRTRQAISRQGIEEREISRDISICAHAILGPAHRPFIICDTHNDKRFSGNPRILGPPYIRFYIGVPLTLRSGLNIGTLCVLDKLPRENPSIERIEGLQGLAMNAVTLIERYAKNRPAPNSKLMKSVDARIGKKIKERRIELGFAPELLEKLMNLRPGELSKIECGEKRTSEFGLMQLSRILKVDFRFFFCWKKR